MVRYADTAGENTDRPLPHAWRYRNWVIDALNTDLPCDAFARQQIAGDILTTDADAVQRRAGVVATGYLAIARRFGHDLDKETHLLYEDVIDNVGKNFLGLSIGCARCHDHKYDPITAADYYALYGVFDSTRFAFPGCEAKGQPRDLLPLLPVAEVEALTADYQQRLAESEQPSQEAAEVSQRLKPMLAELTRVLAESAVGEGGIGNTAHGAAVDAGPDHSPPRRGAPTGGATERESRGRHDASRTANPTTRRGGHMLERC